MGPHTRARAPLASPPPWPVPSRARLPPGPQLVSLPFGPQPATAGRGWQRLATAPSPCTWCTHHPLSLQHHEAWDLRSGHYGTVCGQGGLGPARRRRRKTPGAAQVLTPTKRSGSGCSGPLRPLDEVPGHVWPDSPCLHVFPSGSPPHPWVPRGCTPGSRGAARAPSKAPPTF